MEHLLKYIEELNQLAPDWMEEFGDNDDYINEQDVAVRNQFNGIIGELREIYKAAGLKEVEQQLEHLFNHKKVIKQLMELVNRTTYNYKLMTPVRHMEKDKNEIVKMLINAVFEKAITRIELGVADTYSQYNLKTEKEWMDIIQVVGSLTEYYVRKHWSKKTIMIDFGDETGCSEEICEFYADLLEKSYQELRFNLLMDDIAELNGDN